MNTWGNHHSLHWVRRGQPEYIAIPTPGPLDYDPKQQKSEIAYSIIGKNTEKIEDKSPGPMKVHCQVLILV